MGARKGLTRRGLAAICLFGVFACADSSLTTLTLVATTTVEDSGLLAEIIDTFERAHPGIRLSASVAPTGQALTLGRAGNADLLITHAPAAESSFVAAGYGTRRIPLMRNRFIIAGPASDPAGIAGLPHAAGALERIAEACVPFVSRGDSSGTHRKELTLWRAAVGAATREGEWYLRSGAGMAQALRLASVRQAYILTDQATFLNLRERLNLVPLVEGGDRMINRYAVVLVSGAARADAVRTFVAWITEGDGRAVIAGYGKGRFGHALFTPADRAERH